ncbi:hypothetical protein QE152_g24707 [Popillia japonica]|uniref:Uncharacterized protein n=1 Tax=Popillia japonica TaxID=7064 RepID=A0AAW1K4V4_POPJA
MNVIQNLWAVWDNNIRNHKISSRDELKKVLLGEWQKITPQITKKLATSMPKRMQAMLVTELINTGVATVLYAIGFLVQIIVWISPPIYTSYRGVNIAAGVFGIFNAIAYGLATMLLYREWKSTRTN